MPEHCNPYSANFGHSLERKWVTFAAYCGLLIFLGMLPHRMTDDMTVHKAIAQALLAGNNWGRQCLVGSLDYPPLPTLLLVGCEAIAPYLQTNGPQLLVTLSQGLAIISLIRLSMKHRDWFTAPLPAAIAILVPCFREAFLTLDPGWAAAPFLAAAIYHATQAERHNRLRDFVLTSLHCGLLTLCGVAPAFTGLALLVALHCGRRVKQKKAQLSTAGTASLLWPFLLYALLLWFLWNKLVMGDILFAFRPLFAQVSGVGKAQLSSRLQESLPGILPAITLIAPLFILLKKSQRPATAACLLLALLGLMAAQLLCVALCVPAPGRTPLLIIAALGVCCLTLVAPFVKGVPHSAACLAALLCCVVFANVGLPVNASPHQDHPSREELTAFIDQYWPDSRTMLYGIRLPALYPDPFCHRFVQRLDYQQDDLLTQAKDEQLHLLLPPDDGRFHPKHAEPFASFREDAPPWLLLERQWPNGWQLWRLVPPPKGESRLDFLR